MDPWAEDTLDPWVDVDEHPPTVSQVVMPIAPLVETLGPSHATNGSLASEGGGASTSMAIPDYGTSSDNDENEMPRVPPPLPPTDIANAWHLD